MKSLNSILAVCLVVFAKLSLISSAQAQETTETNSFTEIESNALFQKLMHKVSPKAFQVENERDHEVSFVK